MPKYNSMTKQEAFELADEIADQYGEDLIKGFQVIFPSVQLQRPEEERSGWDYGIYVAHFSGDIDEIKNRQEWQELEQKYAPIRLQQEWKDQRKGGKAFNQEDIDAAIDPNLPGEDYILGNTSL